MKQISLLLLCIGMILSAQAQNAYKAFTGNGGIITNATTTQTTGQFIGPAATYAQPTAIQCDIATASGTIAGNLYLQGSLTNVNFSNVSTDTFKISSTNTSHLWHINPTYDNYYRILIVPTGTQSDTLRCYWLSKSQR